jgi:hypothetical protein
VLPGYGNPQEQLQVIQSFKLLGPFIKEGSVGGSCGAKQTLLI